MYGETAKTIYIPIGLCLIGYFIYRLTQGVIELQWVGLVLIFNTFLFWLYPVTRKSSEENALKSATKILNNPVLAKEYIVQNNVTQSELEECISTGELQAYELDNVLIVENG